MKQSHHRWLIDQLPDWERDGLLTSDASHALRQKHLALQADLDARPGPAQAIIASLGALLIGSGLIAVISYNWDAFSRPMRLLFAFAPLLAAQIASLRVLWRGASAPSWTREAAALLQAFATGACLAIVSQVYNLGGEWPDFLFWWMLLSLPLAWVLRSHGVAILYLIAIAIWSVNQSRLGWLIGGWGDRAWHESSLLYPLLLLGLLPYWPGWPKAKAPPTAVRWMIVISAMTGLFVAAGEESRRLLDHGWGCVWLWSLTAAAITLFPLNRDGIDEPTRRKPQVVLGSLWLVGYGLAGTFAGLSDDFARSIKPTLTLPWCWGLLALLAAFTLQAVRQRRWPVLAIASIALVPLVGFSLDRALAVLFTLHFVFVGVLLIALDFKGRRGAPRLGALLLCLLIIARMVDSDLSFLTKGIAFIFAGSGFLAFNFFMSRRHRQSLSPSA